jgi:hypothetical protein
VFSRTYLTKLESAKSDINNAIPLLLACGVDTVQGQLKSDLDKAAGRIQRLEQTLRVQGHEMAIMVNNLFQLNGLENTHTILLLPDRIVERLVQHNLVADRRDCCEQLREIQEAKDAFRREKAFFEIDLLENILALSLQDTRRTSPPPAAAAAAAAQAVVQSSSSINNMTSANAGLLDTIFKLKHPILQDTVQDPVLLQLLATTRRFCMIAKPWSVGFRSIRLQNQPLATNTMSHCTLSTAFFIATWPLPK